MRITFLIVAGLLVSVDAPAYGVNELKYEVVNTGIRVPGWGRYRWCGTHSLLVWPTEGSVELLSVDGMKVSHAVLKDESGHELETDPLECSGSQLKAYGPDPGGTQRYRSLYIGSAGGIGRRIATIVRGRSWFSRNGRYLVVNTAKIATDHDYRLDPDCSPAHPTDLAILCWEVDDGVWPLSNAVLMSEIWRTEVYVTRADGSRQQLKNPRPVPVGGDGKPQYSRTLLRALDGRVLADLTATRGLIVDRTNLTVAAGEDYALAPCKRDDDEPPMFSDFLRMCRYSLKGGSAWEILASPEVAAQSKARIQYLAAGPQGELYFSIPGAATRRHRGIWRIDPSTGGVTHVSQVEREGQVDQEPQVSGDGNYVAFARDQHLYIAKKKGGI